MKISGTLKTWNEPLVEELAVQQGAKCENQLPFCIDVKQTD
jgi:hypothetical protein